MSDESFQVYCAGEEIVGTGITMTYVYAVTPVGRIRMTEEEANSFGRALVAAAAYNQELED